VGLIIGGGILEAKYLNINELAERTGIPDTSVRRYIAKFPHFFKYKGGTRSRRYEDKSVKVLLRIKTLYDSGYETDQADEILRQEGFAMIVDGDKVEEKSVIPYMVTAEDVAEIVRRETEPLKKALEEQMNFNKVLIEKLEQQQKSLDKRDQLLLESIKEIQERKRIEVAATKEEEKNKGFFSRLFGK
jgi:DNA-binding transcriptional MerR regulator